MKMNPVVHFEMPSKNKKRTKKFYETAFGWQMTQFGQEMGDYLLAGTTPVDKNNMATTPGAINGGFFEYKDEPGFNSTHIVIQVDNVDEAIENVKKAGGKITSDKMDIQGIGTYASFKDTEGNIVGMLQPSR